MIRRMSGLFTLARGQQVTNNGSIAAYHSASQLFLIGKANDIESDSGVNRP